MLNVISKSIVVIFILGIALTGCGGKSSTDSSNVDPVFQINITGLTGRLIFSSTSLESHTVSTNGDIIFYANLSEGDNYHFEILEQPVNQECVVKNGDNVIGENDDVVYVWFQCKGDWLGTVQWGDARDNLTNDIALDLGDNVYVVSHTKKVTGSGSYETQPELSRFDSAGRKLWTTEIDTDRGNFNSVVIDGQGNTIVWGEVCCHVNGTSTVNGTNYVLAKFNPRGEEIWVKVLGEHRAVKSGADLAVDLNGNFYVSGETDGNIEDHKNSGLTDAFVTKLSPELEVLWTQVFATSGYDNIKSITLDHESNAIVMGNTTGHLGSDVVEKEGVFVAKLDENGDVSWINQFGILDNEFANALAVDSNQNIYVAGSSALPSPMMGNQSGFLVKLSETGSIEWTRTSTASFHGLTVGNDNQVVVSGSYTDTSNEVKYSAAIVSLFDSQGYNIWTTEKRNEWVAESPPQYVRPKAVEFDSLGNVIIAGSLGGNFLETESNGLIDNFLFKLNSDGILQ
jgi:hypothetical protein